MSHKLIKICGITDSREARWLNNNAVDFAGFVVFFPKSKRNITIDQAKTIFEVLDSPIKKVAVVVEPGFEEAFAIEEAGFDYIQIHGKLDDRILDDLSIPILKAFNGSEIEHFDEYAAMERIAGFVFDAADPGSGKSFDWNMLCKLPKTDKLTLLAGGLSAENVAAAIEAVPMIDGVDVSSGVELGAQLVGKDEAKIACFVEQVRNYKTKGENYED